MLPPQLFQNALESAPDAIVITDAAGSIIFASSRVEALFGYRSDEIEGQAVEQLLPERFRAKHVAHRRLFVQDPHVRPMGAGIALFARRKNGEEFPVEICLSPIREGEHLLTTVAIRDVTDRALIEAELIAAREKADRANAAKSRFLATASHDLRQPLQVLALLNGTLCRLATDAVSAEALIHQEQAIGAMSRLLNALLDISKLESGVIRPELTDFTVAALFEELRQEFAGLADVKGLQLRIEPCTDQVRSDPSLVEQILRNLVSNAIKYTREGWVQLRCLHEQTRIRLEVLDTGIGIPAEQMPYIYDEFFQVEIAPNDTRNGYGLGLSIVSRLVKMLDLKLEVQSEPGKGSRFSLELPAGSGAPGQCIATRPVAPSIAPLPVPPLVLLVEDDASVREATRMLLRAEGYEVLVAASNGEALQQFGERHRLDLLIADYHLGSGQTGMQVLASLRTLLRNDFKAILMTGDTSSQIKELSFEGQLRVVSKPIQAEQLLALIRQLLAS